MSQAADIAELLERVQSRAFSEVYRLTSGKLYGTVLRILRRRDLADEIVQEAYMKIWDRAADFNSELGSPITWMTAIARNKALDELRRKRPDSVEDHPEVQEFATDEETALATIERGEDGRRLAECLMKLEPDRRKMVVLAYCDGLSRDELAAKYGQPVNTIKTWLRRSLMQLKGCLEA
jgi:RNA polymerase sigma-70 factor (ECF subfamily)